MFLVSELNSLYWNFDMTLVSWQNFDILTSMIVEQKRFVELPGCDRYFIVVLENVLFLLPVVFFFLLGEFLDQLLHLPMPATSHNKVPNSSRQQILCRRWAKNTCNYYSPGIFGLFHWNFECILLWRILYVKNRYDSWHEISWQVWQFVCSCVQGLSRSFLVPLISFEERSWVMQPAQRSRSEVIYI